jgi:molybdopterin-guanine dinucleotide biosynthesis protein A
MNVRSPRAPAIGAVLAGGRSSRMGSPKALVEMAGRPLLAHALASVEAGGLEPLVVAKPDSPLPPVGSRVLREPRDPRHPLTGIVAALEAGGGRPAVVVACDMPFVPSSLLAWLAERDEPLVVPRVEGRLEPLLARYAPALLDGLRSALAEERPLRDAVASLEPALVEERELERFGDPATIVLGVNDPGELERARRIWAGYAGAETVSDSD